MYYNKSLKDWPRVGSKTHPGNMCHVLRKFGNANIIFTGLLWKLLRSPTHQYAVYLLGSSALIWMDHKTKSIISHLSVTDEELIKSGEASHSFLSRVVQFMWKVHISLNAILYIPHTGKVLWGYHNKQFLRHSLGWLCYLMPVWEQGNNSKTVLILL